MTHDETTMELRDTAALPRGFRAAGVHCGVKPERPDLALFVSDTDATVAGTFTTNRVQAAPVQWCRPIVALGTARAIVMNSGNANACTGEPGMRDAERMAAVTADHLQVAPDHVLVSSTGPIGVPLPMEAVATGIGAATAALSASGGQDAAVAMMTTDTVSKHVSTTVQIDGQTITITGVAKGSGMIHPNMATMLAYLFTDAAVDSAGLQSCLLHAVRQSFNRITVDGDCSTNDTVLFLANGAAGNEPLNVNHAAWQTFSAAVLAIAMTLAQRIVMDGEGASRFVTVHVRGAASAADADRAARAVGNSLLVKTSWAGGDPNWSRALCAVGYSGADIDPARIDIDYDDVPAARGGTAADTPRSRLQDVAARSAFALHIDLHRGEGEAVVYASDTTEAYVQINIEE